jgi:hypothetical protein
MTPSTRCDHHGATLKILLKSTGSFICAMLSSNTSATEEPVEYWTRHTIGQMLMVFVVVICNFLSRGERRGQNDSLNATLTYIAVTDLVWNLFH